MTTTKISEKSQLPKGVILVRILGEIYDLTDFAKHHPVPTDVLTPLAGKDATLEVLAAHDVEHKPWKVLKRLKYRGPNKKCSLTVKEVDQVIPHLKPEDKDLVDLQQRLERDGLYNRSWRDYVVEELWGAFCVFFGFAVMMYSAPRKSCLYWIGFFSATVGLSKCGDHCHNLLHSNRSSDSLRWYGLTTFGVDFYLVMTLHRVHHAYTSIVGLDEATEAGPFVWHFSQVGEQSKMSAKSPAPKAPKFLRLRGILAPFVYYFLAYLSVLPGAFSGILPSFCNIYLDPQQIHQKKRPGVVVGLFALARMLFISYHIGLWHFWLVHTVATAVTFGTTTGQHFDDPMTDDHYTLHETSFFRHNLSTSFEYSGVPWLLKMFGMSKSGSTEHILHHLLPGLPPSRLAIVKPEILKICKKHDIQYREVPFWAALWRGITANYHKAIEIEEHFKTKQEEYQSILQKEQSMKSEPVSLNDPKATRLQTPCIVVSPSA